MLQLRGPWGCRHVSRGFGSEFSFYVLFSGGFSVCVSVRLGGLGGRGAFKNRFCINRTVIASSLLAPRKEPAVGAAFIMASATARIGALLALLAAGTDALRLPLAALGHASGASSAALPVAVCRRAVLALPGAAAAAGLLLGGAASPAMASGGATAGKTTSIPRAKLRYYARITGAVAAFERLSDALSAGSMGELKAFFAKDGPYDELQGAGFLLAVAFKIDSKIPPDKVPTVRMHKCVLAPGGQALPCPA